MSPLYQMLRHAPPTITRTMLYKVLPQPARTASLWVLARKPVVTMTSMVQIQVPDRSTHSDQTDKGNNCTKHASSDNNAKPQNQQPPKDSIKQIPEIKIKKEKTVKEVFQEFYRLYGPVFVGCHVAMSLTSLGFFCSIVWLTIDPIKYVPMFVLEKLGDKAAQVSGNGGKFILAYAIHKSVLPLRLGASVWLTKLVSARIKSRRIKPDGS